MNGLPNKDDVADLLCNWFKSVAVNSSKKCHPGIWQEPEAPQCLLEMEASKNED